MTDSGRVQVLPGRESGWDLSFSGAWRGRRVARFRVPAVEGGPRHPAPGGAAAARWNEMERGGGGRAGKVHKGTFRAGSRGSGERGGLSRRQGGGGARRTPGRGGRADTQSPVPAEVRRG